MKEIVEHLNEKETILWKGKPINASKADDLFSLILILGIFGQIIIIYSSIFDLLIILSAVIILCFTILNPIFSLLQNSKKVKNTTYIITNQRIIIFKNQIVNFNDIINLKEFEIYEDHYLWTIKFHCISNKLKNNRIEFKTIREYIEITRILTQLIHLKAEQISKKKVIFRKIE